VLQGVLKIEQREREGMRKTGDEFENYAIMTEKDKLEEGGTESPEVG